MTARKRILAVSYAYPPLKWPRASQVHRLLGGLADAGHPITLIHAEAASAFGDIDESMRGLPPHPGIETLAVNAWHRNPLARAARRLVPTLRHLPDNFNSWIWPACRAVGGRLGAGGDWVLCTFSNPWSDHLVGAWASRKFGIPWIAHFSDPWASNPYIKWGPRLAAWHRRMERRVVEGAQGLVFVSEETRALFAKAHGSVIEGKSRVVPHIMAPELKVLRTRRKQNAKLTFTYAGEFYGPRSPVPLFRALAALREERPAALRGVEVKLVGKLLPEHVRAMEELRLGDTVTLAGQVSMPRSLEYIVNADILLLIDAVSEGESVFLPSKLVEYLGSGNPVLGITPGRGASASMILRANGLVADPEDIPAIRRALLTLIEEHATGRLAAARRYEDGLVSMYTQADAAQRFSDIVEEAGVREAVLA